MWQKSFSIFRLNIPVSREIYQRYLFSYGTCGTFCFDIEILMGKKDSKISKLEEFQSAFLLYTCRAFRWIIAINSKKIILKKLF